MNVEAEKEALCQKLVVYNSIHKKYLEIPIRDSSRISLRNLSCSSRFNSVRVLPEIFVGVHPEIRPGISPGIYSFFPVALGLSLGVPLGYSLGIP